VAEHDECNKQIDELRKELEEARERMRALEERLRGNSSNSSRPPSSDGPDVKRFPKKPPSGKKPGGQPGHGGSFRALLPPEQVTQIFELKPGACDGCGTALAGNDIEPQRHQVTELPVIRPVVSEYRLHSLACRACGAHTRADLPSDVPSGAFGPRLMAMVAVSSGVYHLGKRSTVGLLADWFGIKISTGSIIACERMASAALKASFEEAHTFVKAQPEVNADETPWREARKLAWLWVAASKLVTVFLINARRGQDAAKNLLGEYQGILGSDRFHAYNLWATEKRQVCWAHLARLWLAFSQRDGDEGQLGISLHLETQKMFYYWHRTRDGTIPRQEFLDVMTFHKERVEALLERGKSYVPSKTSRQCAEVLKVRAALWTFLDVEGVEPTNNKAERAIRPAVIWRKLSFGTHSAEGSRFVERLMTAATTLRQQKRNVVDFIADVCTAHVRGLPPPSLLPAQETAPA
jgi:transposase